ncbi:TetR/AcrR family transcriptional regulator [Mangrovihabitans endophyticus]|nr:TetR/AcrR family transcriptional regulator [Mangrovihabitans endophyticus]
MVASGAELGLRERKMGLRERKKAATRQALHESALRLAMEHGPDRVTVEAIADAAGVSRRTFSNYFANKDEALLHGEHQRMRALLDIVRSRPAHETPWQALTAAAEEFYLHVGDLDPEWVAGNRMVRSQPSLIATQLRTFATWERELAAAVTARSADDDPLRVRARLTAATFLMAMRVSLDLWLDRPADVTLAELVRAALAEAGRGFA